MLPVNPDILYSVINTKLRDSYPSLEALCDDLDEDMTALTERLAAAGYEYSPEMNRFQSRS